MEENNNVGVQGNQTEVKKENNKKSGNGTTIALIIVLIVLIAGIITGIVLLVGGGKKESTSSNNATSNSSEANKTISNNTTNNVENKTENIEITYTTKLVREFQVDNAVYMCKEQVPEIKGLDENVAKKIADYIKKWNSDIWKDINSQNTDEYLRTILQGAGETHEKYEIGFIQSYEVDYLNDKVITFKSKFDGSLGGVSWYSSSGVSFDLTTGNVIDMSNIVTSKEEYINACKKYVLEELKKDSRFEEVKSMHGNDYEEAVNTTIEKLGGYFVKEGIVCVEIPRYLIASGAAGEFRYAIPYSLVKDYIKSAYDFSNVTNKADTIKQDYIDNSKKVGTESKTEAESGNTTQTKAATDEHDKAVFAIRTALKNKEWIKNNVSIKKDWGENELTDLDSQKHTFMVLRNEANAAPIVIVYTTTDSEQYSGSYQLFIVSYANGAVTAVPMTAHSNHAGHCYMQVDANNKIAKYAYGHMNYGLDIYLKITPNGVEELDRFNYEFSYDENDINTMIRENFMINNKSVTEEEIKKIEDKYKDCKFYDITTDITDANVDEYVK